jgi:hypothetical protein
MSPIFAPAEHWRGYQLAQGKRHQWGDLNKKSDDGFWWKPERGNQKEVVFKTVANVISGWRIKGVLPA